MDSKTGVAASSHKDEPDTESKAIQTRRRILDAAAYALSTKGYAGLRLTHVAERADLDATAIYYNFPSRDDLIEHVTWVGIADTLHSRVTNVSNVVGVRPVTRATVSVTRSSAPVAMSASRPASISAYASGNPLLRWISHMCW